MMRLKRMREEMLLAKERDLSDRQRGVEVSVNVAGRAFPGTAPGKLGLLPAFSPNIASIQLLFYTCTVQACGGRSMRALQPSTANHLTFRIALSTRDMHLNASRRWLLYSIHRACHSVNQGGINPSAAPAANASAADSRPCGPHAQTTKVVSAPAATPAPRDHARSRFHFSQSCRIFSPLATGLCPAPVAHFDCSSISRQKSAIPALWASCLKERIC